MERKGQIKISERKKIIEILCFFEQKTRPSSLLSSRINVANTIVKRNARRLNIKDLNKGYLSLSPKWLSIVSELFDLVIEKSKKKVPQRKLKKTQERKIAVEDCLLQDGNSTLTTGKKTPLQEKIL